VEKCL